MPLNAPDFDNFLSIIIIIFSLSYNYHYVCSYWYSYLRILLFYSIGWEKYSFGFSLNYFKISKEKKNYQNFIVRHN